MIGPDRLRLALTNRCWCRLLNPFHSLETTEERRLHAMYDALMELDREAHFSVCAKTYALVPRAILRGQLLDADYAPYRRYAEENYR